MLCEERNRLTSVYIAAIAKHSEVASASEDTGESDVATDTREACHKALAALNAHRREHGC